MKYDIASAYKTDQWIQKFKSPENLRWALVKSVAGATVRMDSILPSGDTVEDLMVEGLIFLKPETFGENEESYYLVMPLFLLNVANTKLKPSPIPLPNLIEPLEGVWNWQRFENFVNNFEVIKVS